MTFFIAPSPDIAYAESEYVYWENGFTDDEINQIIELGNSYSTETGTLFGDRVNNEIRLCQVSWIPYENKSDFLYQKLANITRNLNGQFFGFDLVSFTEKLQYTVYTGESNDHYTWHMDKGTKTEAPRKLSLVLQLSDPSDYEGGDLEILTGINPIKLEKRKGIVWCFPSYILHRVTPVTKGVRRTIVAWVSGPKFK